MTHKQYRQFQIDRDMAILKDLACGPTTAAYLRQHVFRDLNGNVPDKSLFYRRMRKLVEMGYVKVHKLKSLRARAGSPGSTIIYALDERGKNEVCLAYQIERSSIRDVFPVSPSHVGHEIQVSHVFRRAYQEAAAGHYDIEYIYDDKMMKKKTPQRERGQIYYPDVRLKILPKYKDPLRLNVEVETGNKTQDYWTKKITSWGDIVLVIAMTQHRLERLMTYARNVGKKNPVGFALASEFSRGGFVNTMWYWLPFESKAKLLNVHQR